MRPSLYRQIIHWIEEYQTWIEVVDDNLYREYAIFRNGRADCFVSRMLVLRAYKKNGAHVQGMTWIIPEYELDKALATYRKQDRTFRQRIKKADVGLTPKDAEAIIRLATYGIVRLELMTLPISFSAKSYYL